jgi:hypothetical protein
MGDWWDKNMAHRVPEGSDFGSVTPIVKVDARPPSTGALLGVGIVIGGLLAFGAYKFTSEMESERARITPGRSGVI